MFSNNIKKDNLVSNIHNSVIKEEEESMTK